MPLHKLEWNPGFVAQLTQTRNDKGWFAGNLVRWRYGLLEKIGGWLRLFNSTLGGTCRALHAFVDLSGNDNLLLGEDSGAQLYRGSALSNLTFVTTPSNSHAITWDPHQINPVIVATTSSATATVTWNAHGAVTGNTLTFPISYTIGGIKIAAGSTFTITVINANSFTFTLPSAAINNNNGQPPIVGISGPENFLTIFWNNHGLTNGQTFTFEAYTYVLATPHIRGTGPNGAVVFAAGTQVTVVSAQTNQFQFAYVTTGDASTAVDVAVGAVYNVSNGSLLEPIVLQTNGNASNPQPNTNGLLWSLDNIGQNGVVVYANGPIWIYSPGSSNLQNAGAGSSGATQATGSWTTSSTTISIPSGLTWIVDGSTIFDTTNSQTIGTVQSYAGTTLTLAAAALSASAGSNDILELTSPDVAPQINTGAFCAMPQAQIIAFGSEVVFGGGSQDLLLVRWTDAGSYSDWTATASNQAGSYHLGGSGSLIVGGRLAPQTLLLWTDVELWSMQYVGAPFVYSFNILATACGLIAQNAHALLGRMCLWVSPSGFFIFDDSGVRPLPCPVWDIMFTDLDQTNSYKLFCGSNSGTREIWIFYPSATDNYGECSRYLTVNFENPANPLWSFGQLRRTAWHGDSLLGPPLAPDSALLVQQHEVGYDADGSPMAGVYAESGYLDIADGEQIMFVNQFIPDMKWFGGQGTVTFLLEGVMYPQGQQTVSGPYGAAQNNRYFNPRLRARQIAIRIEWEARLGFSARLGTPSIRVAPSGTRP